MGTIVILFRALCNFRPGWIMAKLANTVAGCQVQYQVIKVTANDVGQPCCLLRFAAGGPLYYFDERGTYRHGREYSDQPYLEDLVRRKGRLVTFSPQGWAAHLLARVDLLAYCQEIAWYRRHFVYLSRKTACRVTGGCISDSLVYDPNGSAVLQVTAGGHVIETFDSSGLFEAMIGNRANCHTCKERVLPSLTPWWAA